MSLTMQKWDFPEGIEELQRNAATLWLICYYIDLLFAKMSLTIENEIFQRELRNFKEMLRPSG